MINRLLIRIKTVQLVYAYMQGSLDKFDCDVEMAQSVESSYKLYNYLLGLVVKLTEYRKSQLDNARNKFLPTQAEKFPNARFVALSDKGALKPPRRGFADGLKQFTSLQKAFPRLGQGR